MVKITIGKTPVDEGALFEIFSRAAARLDAAERLRAAGELSGGRNDRVEELRPQRGAAQSAPPLLVLPASATSPTPSSAESPYSAGAGSNGASSPAPASSRKNGGAGHMGEHASGALPKTVKPKRGKSRNAHETISTHDALIKAQKGQRANGTQNHTSARSKK